MFAPCPSRVAFAVASVSILTFPSAPSLAHDAKSGWIYPLECCSNYDCREVEKADIVEGPQGYVIKTTGEVIPMTDAKVKASPDGEFHWCSRGGTQDGDTICLFVPPRGF